MAAAMNALGWHWWPGTHAIPSSAFGNMGQCVRWGVCERGCPAGAKSSFDLAYWPQATAAGARLQTNARVCRITTSRQGDVLILTSDNPPVNALGAAVRQGLARGIEEALGDDSVKAVVIRCDGRTSFASPGATGGW